MEKIIQFGTAGIGKISAFYLIGNVKGKIRNQHYYRQISFKSSCPLLCSFIILKK
jgi:hypothetical protein